jgi:hypothetical protein
MQAKALPRKPRVSFSHCLQKMMTNDAPPLHPERQAERVNENLETIVQLSFASEKKSIANDKTIEKWTVLFQKFIFLYCERTVKPQVLGFSLLSMPKKSNSSLKLLLLITSSLRMVSLLGGRGNSKALNEVMFCC